MANKITKREVINTMLSDVAIIDNEMYVNYLKNELALLDKKANNKKATKNQEENEVLKGIIYETLEEVGASTVTELQNANEVLKTKSNQKISSLLRLMIADGKVSREIVKKVSYFSIA